LEDFAGLEGFADADPGAFAGFAGPEGLDAGEGDGAGEAVIATARVRSAGAAGAADTGRACATTRWTIVTFLACSTAAASTLPSPASWDRMESFTETFVTSSKRCGGSTRRSDGMSYSTLLDSR